MRLAAPSRPVRLALLLLFVVLLAGWLFARQVEQMVREQVERDDPRRPVQLSVDRVHFSWFGPLRLEGVRLARPANASATCGKVVVDWRLFAGTDPLQHLRSVAVEELAIGTAGIRLEVASARWLVVSGHAASSAGDLRLRESGTGGELHVSWRSSGDEQELSLEPARVDAGSLARVSWNGQLVARPGLWSGTLHVLRRGDHVESTGTLHADTLQLGLPQEQGPGELGVPTSLDATWDVARDTDRIRIGRWQSAVGGVELHGRADVLGLSPAAANHGSAPARVALTNPSAGVRVDLALAMRVDLARALDTAGLTLPRAIAIPPHQPLGVASLELGLRGSPAEPASLEVTPHLAFVPAAPALVPFRYLNGPFTHVVSEGTRGPLSIDVRDGAPDFVPIGAVPALFVRTLVLAEDAGFYGHPGIDVGEIPIAWATNIARGEKVRGASTLTQQLVKNLYLSREKSYGRKLEEAALALLVDAAVPKGRQLEIYLNVIEWGPGIHGLKPAAWHYFGKPPSELTLKQIVFLVCLIPSPIRYHEAHILGHAGAGMEQLMARLLAKLRSIDIVTDDAYEQALAEDLQFRPEGGEVQPPPEAEPADEAPALPEP